MAAQVRVALGRWQQWAMMEVQRYQIDTLAEIVRASAQADAEIALYAAIARHALLLCGADCIGFAREMSMHAFEHGYGAPARPRARDGQTACDAFAQPHTAITKPLAIGARVLTVAWRQRFPPMPALEGIPLGVEFTERSKLQRTAVGPGESIVLYADGLLEYDRDLISGESRLIALAHDVGATAPRRNARTTSPFSPQHSPDRRGNSAGLSRPRPNARAKRAPCSATCCAKRRCRGSGISTSSSRRARRSSIRSSGDVRISAHYDDAGVDVEIADTGHYRTGAGMADRGRGTALMHALADDVRIQGQETGTTVRLRFRS
ncbi:MAG: ATP-binding protein [Candidatus Velthaea sp.]